MRDAVMWTWERQSEGSVLQGVSQGEGVTRGGSVAIP